MHWQFHCGFLACLLVAEKKIIGLFWLFRPGYCSVLTPLLKFMVAEGVLRFSTIGGPPDEEKL
jgi:hypothetical protein